GAFSYDPFHLYAAGVLTNPNMVVFGQLGRGKSAFVKSYLWRQAVFGRRAWVVDPKGEYGALARAWGTEPLTLRPGGDLRLNPLDASWTEHRGRADGTREEAAGGHGDAVTRARGELLASLASASLGRSLLPAERTAVELAVDDVEAALSAPGAPPPTLPDVVGALLAPSARAAASVRTDPERLAADGRAIALELRRLVAGDLRGMFDGPTSSGIDLNGPVVVLDLSAVYHSAALGVFMTCAMSWLHAALRAPAAGPRQPVILVVDEAWAVLSNLAVARWLQSSWKMARAWGVANVAVLHRASDLAAAGSSGSEQVSLSQGLLADSETRVVYAQAPGEVAAAAELLGLGETEQELVSRLGRGVALWKVGPRSFLVQHRLSPGEHLLVDTDSRMVPR
ncbi:MAG TPA: hypothetical protein VKR22_06640, partial [Acidimicrobiales bacterium]|nr:hypothetical protein [Acidimicrobiales bacterium]